MSGLTTIATPKVLDQALTAIQNPETPIEDVIAHYALLYAMKREIDRGLGTYTRGKPTAKSRITEHFVREGLEELGPLFVQWEAFDVEWPCNAEGNWGDIDVQDAMAMLRQIAPDYIRHVPEHYEIDTAALGKGIADNDPVARQLHTECKKRRWRIEGGRRPALKVREITRKAA